jgi:tripartite-type tricarboxylate transporter receptor subunit TctC
MARWGTGVWAASATLAMTATALAASARANSVPQSDIENFYKGKTVTIVVSASAGGDYDVRARLLARFMNRHLPGQPTIIVQNMPGAGGVKAANWLYNVAPKDGTALATFNQEMPLTQLFGASGVAFDLAKCAWIGNTMSSPIVLMAWHASRVKTMDDALKAEMTMGGTGAGSGSVQFPLMLNALIGTKFKVISGYPGGSEIYLAMERGEVEGRATQNWAGWKAQKPDWIKNKKIIPLSQGGTERLGELKHVPLIVDYAKTVEARQVLELSLLPDQIARPLVAGPNLPGERVQALRAAFDATMKDSDFLGEARKAKVDIIPSTGAEAQAKAMKILNTPKAVVAQAKRYAGQ